MPVCAAASSIFNLRPTIQPQLPQPTKDTIMRSGSDGWFQWLQRKETDLEKYSATTNSKFLAAAYYDMHCTSIIDRHKNMII
eukprot:scaffold34571_cov129-Skeletonema_dohrnii-CCMP3373.AAC.3